MLHHVMLQRKGHKILVYASVRANKRPTSFANTPFDSSWGGLNERTYFRYSSLNGVFYMNFT